MKKFDQQSLQDISNLPEDIRMVLIDFEKFIDDFDQGKFSGQTDLTPALPHSKEKITQSITSALKIVKDEGLKNYLLVLGGTLDVITNPELLKKVGQNKYVQE